MGRDRHFEHKQYINKYGEDMPEIRGWKWRLGTGHDAAGLRDDW